MIFKSESFTRKPEGLAQELRNLINEAEKILSSDALSRTSNQAMVGLRQQLRAAQEELAHVYYDARKRMTSGARFADDAIRAHPYPSIGVVFGVGLATGILIGRMSRD